MAGTKIGGLRAAAAVKAKHGEDFYRQIGSIGGLVHNPKKGFGTNRELARVVGKIGGSTSRRKKNSFYKKAREARLNPAQESP